MLTYVLPQAGHVELSVHDVRGHKIATIVDAERTAGAHRATWDGRDSRGRVVGSGVYFARLECGGEVRLRKITLAK